MIKSSNYKKTILQKDISNKAVVLAIATIFIIGAFIPAINSQGIHQVIDQPSKNFENLSEGERSLAVRKAFKISYPNISISLVILLLSFEISGATDSSPAKE